MYYKVQTPIDTKQQENFNYWKLNTRVISSCIVDIRRIVTMNKKRYIGNMWGGEKVQERTPLRSCS